MAAAVKGDVGLDARLFRDLVLEGQQGGETWWPRQGILAAADPCLGVSLV
jgi:hypothetical protein